MQRKLGSLHASSCNIKMPESGVPQHDALVHDDDWEQKRWLQLINFGHTQWGFENWSWSVSKQDLDFVDFSNGKYSAGVVAFVSVSVKCLNIHRENIGYATTTAPMKGSAIYQARKGAVTNALRETLLSFGGNVTTELLELLETQKTAETSPTAPPAPAVPAVPPSHPPEPNNQENNQNIPNKPAEPKNTTRNGHFHPPRKDSVEGTANPTLRSPQQQTKQAPKNPVVQNPPPPVAKALPMPANLPPVNKPNLGYPANQPRPPPPPQPRPNSNDAKPAPAPTFEGMTEEEVRVERKRRQRQAQEEFRQKQMLKLKSDTDDRPELHRSSFDNLMLQLPSQDIVIEETGSAPEGKRPSPERRAGAAPKRRHLGTKLDIVTD